MELNVDKSIVGYFGGLKNNGGSSCEEKKKVRHNGTPFASCPKGKGSR